MLVIEECYPIKKEETYNDLHFGDLFKWSIDSPVYMRVFSLRPIEDYNKYVNLETGELTFEDDSVNDRPIIRLDGRLKLNLADK